MIAPAPSQRQPADLAWFAGLFEGEGHIGVKRRRATGRARHDVYHLRVAVAMTDREIVELFNRYWRGDMHRRSYRSMLNARDQWRWEVTTWKAFDFLTAIQPYVRSDRVQTKISAALEFQGQKLSPGGGASAPESYHAAQRAFYDRFRLLNATGVARA